VSTEENKQSEPQDRAPGEPGEPEQPKQEELDDKRMSLLEHLQELRVRLRNAAIAFVIAMAVAFGFVEKFFAVLARPIAQGIRDAGQEVKFQATTPTEGFWVMMKLALVGGLLVAAPFVFWELWKFVAPGLYKKERKLALAVTGATAFCFIGGALFGYFVLAHPASYFLTKMLTSFGSSEFAVVPEYRIENVADFLILTLAGCGVAFELPVVMVLLGALGIVTARGLWKFNKYALILAAVAGAVLTPSTDPFTQILLATPLFTLYNISILFVWLIERARNRKLAALERGEGPS
jgi:sec-independent protein translocase protein TatC